MNPRLLRKPPTDTFFRMGHVCNHQDHQSHPQSNSEEWLRMHRIRVTDQRKTMISFLRKNQHPITLAELHKATHASDFTTVFRFIQLLEKKNLVQQHHWEDNQVRYEINEGHHHYLICKICHHYEPIEGCVLHITEKQLKKNYSYTQLSHRLEFFGICPQCQKKSKKIASISS